MALNGVPQSYNPQTVEEVFKDFKGRRTGLIKALTTDWENLPKNLLDSVVKKLLTPSDYLGFTLVCRTWYSVAKENRSKEAAVKAKRLPLVVFYTGRKDYWKLYDVVDRKVLDFQVRMPNEGLVGSSKGWLMFAHRNVAAKTFGVTLVNPFLRVRGRKPKENSLIVLPPLTPPGWEKWYAKYWKFIMKGTISADPILDANNCIAMVSHLERCTMAFHRLGKDETWTYVRDGFGDNGQVPRCYLIDEVINAGNTFYTVNQWCELLSFDVTPQSHSDVKLVGGNIPTTRNIKRYIVRGEDDKLFMVHRFIKFTFDSTLGDRRTTYEFRVFEFDFQKDEWIEKRTLGDVALFIGYNSSICLPASNIFGFKSNCIYFNHDRDDVATWYAAYDFGIYNYENKSFLETYTKEAMDLLRMSYPLPTWVLPTINFPL